MDGIYNEKSTNGTYRNKLDPFKNNSKGKAKKKMVKPRRGRSKNFGPEAVEDNNES